MTPFGAYSRYYDLLYQDKNYPEEAEFIASIMRRYLPGARTLLDLGCGTGLHACAFARAGYEVTGLDRSPGMIERARERYRQIPPGESGRAEFAEGDIRDFELNRRYDVVVALFHVISYLPANADLDAAFACIAKHLRPGGLFIFDHWYGPAVLNDRPAPRVKMFENGELKITRVATPTLLVNDNLVDVRYDLLIFEKSAGRCEQITETHRVRYLFRPEIDSLLSRHGFRRIAFRKWLTDKTPDETSWNTFVVAAAES